MNITWDEMIEEVKNKTLESAGWLSDQAALLKIFEYAKENGLEVPEKLTEFHISNFREIVPDGKIAVRRHDNEWLESLLELAANKSVRQLRLEMGKIEIETVPVEKVLENNTKYLLAKFTENQFEYIQKSLVNRYKFEIRR